MLLSASAIYLPGRSATTAALLAGLTAAAALWCLWAPEHRPPLAGLLAALPIAILVLVPFAAAGRAGILGTGLSNDMGQHMAWAEGFASQAAAEVRPLPPDYPLGPHAMVAAIATGTGIRIDAVFAGWTMVLPLITGWTAQALLRRPSWFARTVVATVVGIPFLVAAYYGEGAFKEVLLGGLVLAMALLLGAEGPGLSPRARWIPFALLTAGVLSAYSAAGLPWPVVLLGVWLCALAIGAVGRKGASGAVTELRSRLRAALPAAGIGLGVLVLVLLPQLAQIVRFVEIRGGTGIRLDDFGNIFGPLPGWEAFGVWSSDFRQPASPSLPIGIWIGLVVALALVGCVWAARRGRWMLPLAAAGSMLIWVVSSGSQSPYVSAKALVVASPLLLALAVLPLVEREPRDRAWLRVAGALVALLLFVRVGISDFEALRISPVGPTSHVDQLRSLRPMIEGRPTLFLGNDDYVKWELAAVPLGTPTINGIELLPTRSGKKWKEGEALDFDSVDAATLDRFEWVIAPRDAAGSEPPASLQLVRTTADYGLWRRRGPTAERSVLAEGGEGGRTLRCDTAPGRRVLHGRGVAAVRPRPVVVPAPSAPVGTTVAVSLDLAPGRWRLQTPYRSAYPVEVVARGLRTTLPANLDRPGPRWPIGSVVVGDAPTTVSFTVGDTPLAPPASGATLGSVVATPVGARESVVPIRRACGRYVDWYRAPRALPEAAGRR
jgi:hypothetical protein